MSNLPENITSDDLVISKQAGGFYSGGFNVSSILKEGNSPVINNFSRGISGGKKDVDPDIFDLFKNLSIPRGIFSMKTEYLNSKHNYNPNRHRPGINEDEHLNDDMMDKLLKLVEPKHNINDEQLQHKKTKKFKNKSKKNKTKKQSI